MDIVKNVEVYGLDESLVASGYPMMTEFPDKIPHSTMKDLNRARKLANTKIGEGHDNFLQGIVVQFDLTFTNKAWVEMQRYHHIDFVSSGSTIHMITKFNLDETYNEYVDPRIIEIMKEKVDEYNKLKNVVITSDLESAMKHKKELNEKYREILYNNPAGFRLTARMTTNYRQLKTIYKQRKNHILKEWHEFCDWIETLPLSELIIGE